VDVDAFSWNGCATKGLELITPNTVMVNATLLISPHRKLFVNVITSLQNGLRVKV